MKLFFISHYQGTKFHIRTPLSWDWLEECFLNRISMKVDIRYRPSDMDSAFILYEGKHYPLLKTDKNANCHTKRNNLPSIDYAKLGGTANV